MKKIEMVFYKTKPSENNIGLKYVLWEVNDGTTVAHDWGFANWTGSEWEAIEVPNGYTADVIWWANTVDADLLLKQKSKIISLR